MRKFQVMLVFLTTVLLLAAAACDDSTNEPVDADVIHPTNLRASSTDEAIILEWTPSQSENQDNFGGYRITILNRSTTQTTTETADKGSGTTLIDLDNGTRYLITVRSVTTQGKESSGFSAVEWAPANRRYVDLNNKTIRVYATTSIDFNSGIDLYNVDGKTEVIPQKGSEFKDRGDFYVNAENETSNFLQLISPDQAVNNQGEVTRFSSIPAYDADDLDESTTTSAPSLSSYKEVALTITAEPVDHGKVFYGRIERSNGNFYFRLLIKRGVDGTIVHGSGIDRYIEMDVSYQHEANVPIAKQ